MVKVLEFLAETGGSSDQAAVQRFSVVRPRCRLHTEVDFHAYLA